MYCLGIICLSGDAFALALKYIMEAWAVVRHRQSPAGQLCPRPACRHLGHCAAVPLPSRPTSILCSTHFGPCCVQVEAFVLDIYKQAMAIGRALLQSTPALWDKMGAAAADVAKKMCEVTPCSSEFTKSVEVSGLCVRVVCCGRSCGSSSCGWCAAAAPAQLNPRVIPPACRPSWASPGAVSLAALKTLGPTSSMALAACLADQSG